MSNQLLQKNIFYKKSKDKFNPDVVVKKKNIEKERTGNIFKQNNVVYNSITNQAPSNIKKQSDLILTKDEPISNIDKLVTNKLNERLEQETQNKMIKQKVALDDINAPHNAKEYTDLKNMQINYSKTQTKEILVNKNKYENIMKNLKDLGIINN
jgi:hypothetical protein